ncbi:MAG: hypothetical protein V3T24_05585, partial [Longimicrobiales bacterium]
MLAAAVASPVGAVEQVSAPSVADTVRFQVPLRLPTTFLDRLSGPERQPAGPSELRLGLKPVTEVDGMTPGMTPRPVSLSLQTPGAWLLTPGAIYIRRRLALRARSLIGLLALPPPSAMARQATAAGVRPGQPPASPLTFVSGVSNLDLELTGRAELGGDWTRFRPCDTRVQFTCDPGIIPQLTPDIQFGVRMQGTISDRLTVDVDFDQAREFSAANRINISYEGRADEILQRLELGDVTFALP